jgi:hypothetical protein
MSKELLSSAKHEAADSTLGCRAPLIALIQMRLEICSAAKALIATWTDQDFPAALLVDLALVGIPKRLFAAHTADSLALGSRLLWQSQVLTQLLFLGESPGATRTSRCFRALQFMR